MMKMIGLIVLHGLSLFFLLLLWKEKNAALKRGFVMTRMGHVGKRKSPRLFYFSIWIDFILLLIFYVVLIAYSISLLIK